MVQQQPGKEKVDATGRPSVSWADDCSLEPELETPGNGLVSLGEPGTDQKNAIHADGIYLVRNGEDRKKFIAEEISNVSLTMQNLIRKYRDTKDEQKYEYLNSYTEFRYMQILGSFHKIIQQFYI